MLWLLLIGIAFAEPADDGVLVDQVLVVVENTPIAASRVDFAAAVRERTTDPDVFGRVLTERVESLESLIFQEVLRAGPAREVRLSDKQPGLQRLRAFEGTFRDTGDATAFRNTWGVDRAAMLEFFQETARLDATIDLAIRFEVTADEEQTYYERHKDDVFAGRPYGEVANQVARRVYALKFEAEYNSWRARLRSGASLRYVAR
jgi:hypothetical protein